MKRRINTLFQCIILAMTMLQCCFLSFADDGIPRVEITEGSNKLTLTNLSVAIYATEITFYLQEESFQGVEFIPSDANYESFIKENGEKSISLYVVSGTVMNNDCDTINLGELTNSDGLKFLASTVKIVNFLQYPKEYDNVPVYFVEGEDSVPDEKYEEESNDEESNDEESSDEESSDEESSDDEPSDDTPEEESDSTGGNFPSSSGGSYSSDGSEEDGEVDSEVEEEVVEPLDQETQARYEILIEAYSDIASHWAKENILYVIDQGYFKGISTTEFAPNQSMTRAMFVTVMHSVDGGYFTTDISHFQDMKQEDWFYVYVSWGVANGITTGVSDTQFNPDGAVTREQMALMVYNYIQGKGYDLAKTEPSTPFADSNSISVWAVDAVDYIRQCGIISGKTGNIFDPQGIATRAEVATIIKNLVQLVEME